MDIFKAIQANDLAAVSEYLALTPCHKVPIDTLKAAIEAGDPGLLAMLAEHKQPLSLKATDEFSVWARALASEDTRHLAVLVKYGAYESIRHLQHYGGTEFLQASREALQYLFDYHLTDGLEQAFYLLMRRRKNQKILSVFPDSYFTNLSTEELVKGINALMPWAPERIEQILIQNDYAGLLRFIFKTNHSARNLVSSWQFVPTVLGTDVAGPAPEWNTWDETFIESVRGELCLIAEALT
jgi:hypothetical protein